MRGVPGASPRERDEGKCDVKLVGEVLIKTNSTILTLGDSVVVMKVREPKLNATGAITVCPVET